jgi:ATP-binding cassette, subfamily B, bacterial
MFVFSFRQNAKMQETFMENRRKIGDVNASHGYSHIWRL